MRHIIDEIVKEGCLWLLITGGEPLIRSDFLDIYAYAKEKGLIITLFTNGTLITTEIADYLKRQKPFVVEITLYGISKETYETVTHVAGSFGRCMEGIRLLLERKIPFQLKTLVSTLNQRDLSKIEKYAKELGVGFRFDPVINPRIDGSKEPCQLRTSPEEVVKFDLGDERRVESWKELVHNFRDHERPDSFFTCGGGLTSFIIDPYGELQLCVLFRRPSYSLREGIFKEGWDNLFPRLRSQKFNKDNKCWRCAYFLVCDQCPGWSQLENEDPEFPVDYLCQIAHLRAKVFLGKEAGNDEAAVQKTTDKSC
jgi:radical SAM protein with 4Fe4S-binding SPASM domain